MDSHEAKRLPPPPPVVPPNLVPELEPTKKTTLLPMARRGFGSNGERIHLLTNHFRVNFNNAKGHFFQYSVTITNENGSPMEAKGIYRKILEKVQETYRGHLRSKYFAYDGDKTLFTTGALPKNTMEFEVVLENTPSSRNNTGSSSRNETNDADRKRLRRPNRSKKFKVEINYAAKIPMQALANAIQGMKTDNLQDATRVLDVILRQNSARKGCLLVRQSFFHNDPPNILPIGEGVFVARGFHTSFKTTQRGLSLNIDTSATMIVKPGPVVDFLLENQNVKDPKDLDWNKAKRALKNLRVKVIPSNREYKITGLSEERCKDQVFIHNLKNEKGEVYGVETTVYKYFTEFRHVELKYSGDCPCINVGHKPARPTYIPIEHCELVSLQRYTKSLSSSQKACLAETSRQRPPQRMASLTTALEKSNYSADPVLQETGVSIGSNFIQVGGRVLPAPRLRVGNGVEFQPRKGRWNFIHDKLVEPATVAMWVVVNFSAQCDTNRLVSELIRSGKMKGIEVEDPYKVVFKEEARFRDAPANIRVEKMFEQMKSELKEKKPLFILCILAEKKNSPVYGPWKRKNLIEHGIVTQCIVPPKDLKDQYITNVLLKINAKLGGLNSMLAMERSQAMRVTQVPTFIAGMDVSHGSPGTDVPSIAAVVGSRKWPLISKYRACVRTQSPKREMIDNLFNRVTNEMGEVVDEGIFRELLEDFYFSSGKREPENIIIFRDGVSDSQFNQVLNIELDQMKKACKFVRDNWNPRFTVIIAQKNQHTKFFQANSNDNVPPGTIVDRRICHPRNNDFYLCAHAGMIGTTRPTHYHVLYDEIRFSADHLQELVHSLSYVYQRSTTAMSVVAPICYAHSAAAQMRTAMKFEDMSFSETASIHDGITRSGEPPVPSMPKLNSAVASSMFFC